MGTQTVGDEATKGINALHEQPASYGSETRLKQSNSILKLT